jgi:hypothetical protein
MIAEIIIDKAGESIRKPIGDIIEDKTGESGVEGIGETEAVTIIIRIDI